jgi:hypothetical protein
MIKLLLLPLLLGILCFVACTATRAGYESAPYETTVTDKAFEVRDYPEIHVVSTSSETDGKRDGRFGRLFRYISGENEGKRKIDMTAPVFMSDGGETSEKGKMSFFLPAEDGKEADPRPTSSDVTLETIPARRYATMRFSGTGKPDEERKAVTALRAWLEEKGLAAAGEPLFAYYDPPWTPAPLRRNEVLIPIGKADNR